LNRHQHLVVLAQACLLTGDTAYRDEVKAALESWWEQNPFLKGINWTSALEVAFRALSWLWIDHLIGESLEGSLRRRLGNSLYQHAAFLECNLSTYFSPNTHLLGEGVALHAIGIKLNHEKWRSLGSRVVDGELKRQVAPDGSHFEQSSYYHMYALDFFVLHYLLAGKPEAYAPVLRKMAHFLAAIVGPERLLTFFGDDDGGRLFYPYGPRELFARATLTTCSLLFPEEQSPLPAGALTCRFPDSGLASIAIGNSHILVDTGPFGFGGAGHSHADTLSITARTGKRELLVDPGTFTYIADPKLRNLFRGTGFHNTIRIDGLDQADPAGPFRWENKPEVRVKEWKVQDGLVYLDASCSYREFIHRRRVLCVADEWLFVLDEVGGPKGLHQIEQFWHLGDRDVPILLSAPEAANWQEGLRSRVMGQKETAPVLCASWKTALPHVCGAALALDGRAATGTLVRDGWELSIPEVISVAFGHAGMPVVTRT
jgi:Heparinase II/III-like protein/Heparinase II/III N-terminus